MRKIFCIAEIFILSLMIIFSTSTSAEGIWRLDGTDKNKMPQNFRVIESLNISASAQPSLDGLNKLFAKIKKIAPDNKKIYILDLRQETHGFADKIPVSFYVEKNRGNFYIGNDEVEEIEISQLKTLIGKTTEFVPLGNHDKKHLKPITCAPKKISTEREAATAAGFNYVRFAATDMIFPAPAVVDEFLNFVDSLEENSWLHFHCHAGHGRTTTFMVFYETLKNPDLTLEEICQQQYLLGGTNLLAKSEGNDWYAQVHNDRAEKLKLFYRYAHEFKDKMTWSEFYQKEMQK